MERLRDFSFYHLQPYAEQAAEKPAVNLAVAGAEHSQVLETVAVAASDGLVYALLFGDEERIRPQLDVIGMEDEFYEVRHCRAGRAAFEAACAAGRGEAQMLMKGMVSSADFLRAMISEQAQLRTGRVLSHLGLFDIPAYNRLLGMTDGGINIDPDFETRVEIVRNAAEAGNVIWGRPPRIALVAALEKVQTNMPVTVDWAAITKMADRGQLGEMVLDGPLGLDNALEPEALRSKGIDSPVQGRADIIVVPDIEAGNLVGKTLTYLADAPMAGLVLGARVPVIMNSRADSARARIASLIMARLISDSPGGVHL